ncbi:hypothetical protein ACHAXA_005266 [Cyclostephanos tholiformis]|uniref:MEKHLA domain-containing protein n=1 Tax=Cyclostephanos tholiformis TaxID=382380 RepID=A0ABD3R2F0_9STRA
MNIIFALVACGVSIPAITSAFVIETSSSSRGTREGRRLPPSSSLAPLPDVAVGGPQPPHRRRRPSSSSSLPTSAGRGMNDADSPSSSSPSLSTSTAVAVAVADHHYSKSTLDWLMKMAISYEIERGEDMLETITREGLAGGEEGVVVVPPLPAIAGESSSSSSSSSYPLRLAYACATTRLHVASHDFLRDPGGEAIYNYGNAAFLDKFGYEWNEFVNLPSRYCVSSDVEADERQRILDDVRSNARIGAGETTISSLRDGNDDGEGASFPPSKYDGLIRVRKDGRRILLRGVNLWNVYDVDITRDGPESSSPRAGIEGGDIAVIGQAVWIRHIDNLD